MRKAGGSGQQESGADIKVGERKKKLVTKE